MNIYIIHILVVEFNNNYNLNGPIPNMVLTIHKTISMQLKYYIIKIKYGVPLTSFLLVVTSRAFSGECDLLI